MKVDEITATMAGGGSVILAVSVQQNELVLKWLLDSWVSWSDFHAHQDVKNLILSCNEIAKKGAKGFGKGMP